MTGPHHGPPMPPIYSAQRLTTLVASIIVALASGTNYVFSAYGPQLETRLGMTQTQLNVVALAGNIGVYSMGPIWGRIVDKRGPRILLTGGFVLLLTGYMGLRHLYDKGLGAEQTSISTMGFMTLATFCYFTGAGGNAGLTSSVNTTARSFPDRMRATTTGLVISGFGLSAFLFSTISHAFFAGSTSQFLLLLATGTSLPMIMGFFLIRPIPLPPHEPLSPVHEHDSDDGNASETPLLDPGSDARYAGEGASGLPDMSPPVAHDVEMSETSPRRRGMERSLSRGAAMTMDLSPNIHGYRLWKTLDFYLLFFSLSLLSGTGLMYINNVGSMSRTLYAHNNPDYDSVTAAKWQATQVSTISVMNCLGRILIGIISDIFKNRYDVPRSYCLILVAMMCFLSQVVASRVDRIADLWFASSTLGLGYGAVFSLFPTVCIEWFGLPHFSENWGYLAMSPMFAGNFFSIVFGWNMDRNQDSAPAPGSPADIKCSRGAECYVASLYMTMIATLVALMLTVWASWRDRKKLAVARRRRGMLLRRGEIS